MGVTTREVVRSSSSANDEGCATFARTDAENSNLTDLRAPGRAHTRVLSTGPFSARNVSPGRPATPAGAPPPRARRRRSRTLAPPRGSIRASSPRRPSIAPDRPRSRRGSRPATPASSLAPPRIDRPLPDRAPRVATMDADAQAAVTASELEQLRVQEHMRRMQELGVFKLARPRAPRRVVGPFAARTRTRPPPPARGDDPAPGSNPPRSRPRGDPPRAAPTTTTPIPRGGLVVGGRRQLNHSNDSNDSFSDQPRRKPRPARDPGPAPRSRSPGRAALTTVIAAAATPALARPRPRGPPRGPAFVN